jgi:hypothetical protein
MMTAFTLMIDGDGEGEVRRWRRVDLFGLGGRRRRRAVAILHEKLGGFAGEGGAVVSTSSCAYTGKKTTVNTGVELKRPSEGLGKEGLTGGDLCAGKARVWFKWAPGIVGR